MLTPWVIIQQRERMTYKQCRAEKARRRGTAGLRSPAAQSQAKHSCALRGGTEGR